MTILDSKTCWRIATLSLGAALALASPAIAADGKALYEEHCQKCHGPDGKGDTKAGKMMNTPDLTTAEWKQGTTAAEVSKTLGAKLGKMPSFDAKLTEEERAAVAQFTIDLTR